MSTHDLSGGWQSSKTKKTKYVPSALQPPPPPAPQPQEHASGALLPPTPQPEFRASRDIPTLQTVILYMFVPAAGDSVSPKRHRCPPTVVGVEVDSTDADGSPSSPRGCMVVSGDVLFRPSAFVPPEGLGIVQLRRQGCFNQNGPADPLVAVVLKVPGPKDGDAEAIDFKSTQLVDLSMQSFGGTPDGHPINLWPAIRDDPFAFDLVHTYSVVRHTLDMVLSDLGIPESMWRWQWDRGGSFPCGNAPVTSPLQILCHAGEKANAVYHRGRRVLKFYYVKGTASSVRRTSYLCRYFDIVAHEVGHAILDSLKPDLYSIHRGQQGALQEAIADLTAIFAQLDIPVMCARVLTETEGNLRVSSSITAIGSRFAASSYDTTGRVVHDGEKEEVLGIRNAISDSTGSTCGSNPYHMANVFSGFVWDVLVSLYEGSTFTTDSDGDVRAPPDRLHRSAMAARKALFWGIGHHISSPTPCFVDVCNAMIAACRDLRGEFDDMAIVISQCAAKRELDLAGTTKKARQEIIYRLMGDF